MVKRVLKYWGWASSLSASRCKDVMILKEVHHMFFLSALLYLAYKPPLMFWLSYRIPWTDKEAGQGMRLTFIMEVSLTFFFSSLFRTFWRLFLILASISYHSLIPVMFPPLSLAHTQIGQGEPVCAKLKEKLVWLCTNLLSILREARCYRQVP